MHRLTALRKNPLPLIGSGVGAGERLIAAWTSFTVGDQPTPETHCGADKAKLTT
jgi:hypothetical protein